jgi:hypothetical protein
MSDPIADFKVRNQGTSIIVSLVGAEGKEIQTITLSWVSAFRLQKELLMATEFGISSLAALIKRK